MGKEAWALKVALLCLRGCTLLKASLTPSSVQSHCPAFDLSAVQVPLYHCTTVPYDSHQPPRSCCSAATVAWSGRYSGTGTIRGRAKEQPPLVCRPVVSKPDLYRFAPGKQELEFGGPSNDDQIVSIGPGRAIFPAAPDTNTATLSQSILQHREIKMASGNASYYNKNAHSPALVRARRPYLFKNAVVGAGIAAFAIGVYVYTIKAIGQDEFADVKVPDAPQQPAKK
ncbi:hypothetical protein JX266_002538 [Neoarthrinium moseri]|nr:hypothetical protein JX266_002538 [Neoarthrinium moseri]